MTRRRTAGVRNRNPTPRPPGGMRKFPLFTDFDRKLLDKSGRPSAEMRMACLICACMELSAAIPPDICGCPFRNTGKRIGTAAGQFCRCAGDDPDAPCTPLWQTTAAQPENPPSGSPGFSTSSSGRFRMRRGLGRRLRSAEPPSNAGHGASGAVRCAHDRRRIPGGRGEPA